MSDYSHKLFRFSHVTYPYASFKPNTKRAIIKARIEPWQKTQVITFLSRPQTACPSPSSAFHCLTFKCRNRGGAYLRRGPDPKPGGIRLTDFEFRPLPRTRFRCPRTHLLCLPYLRIRLVLRSCYFLLQQTPAGGREERGHGQALGLWPPSIHLQ